MNYTDVKLALVFHGMVGSMTGKHYKNEGGSEEVLRYAYTHNKEFILDRYNTDVYFHTWSTECDDLIRDLYGNWYWAGKAEGQIPFEVPEYIRADKDRAFAHLSRWYSFWKAIDYIKQNRVKYTHILIQRWDLCWNVVPTFETMDPNKFWVGKSTLDVSKEWSDRWFCSSKENMLKFSKLYHKIPEYMGPGGSFTSKKQYGGISSHFLSKFHADQENLVPEFKYVFGGHGSKANDYNEVRRQYGGDDR